MGNDDLDVWAIGIAMGAFVLAAFALLWWPW